MSAPEELRRAERDMALLRAYIDSGELTPWCDPRQRNAAVIDMTGLLIGYSDLLCEVELLRGREEL